jgi:predicted flap endonuclease-1-like 5' DNA nuclease
VTAFTLLALMGLAIGIVVAYRVGASRGRRSPSPMPMANERPISGVTTRSDDEARAAMPQLLDFAEDRRDLFGRVADARAETARYRQIVIDIERNAPPPLLDAPGTPDDLKLIVGIGPVIERMLYQLGIGTYRQIAHWSERDIDEFDARLAEFPGRIRRDEWVTQARALHASKYGSPP